MLVTSRCLSLNVDEEGSREGEGGEDRNDLSELEEERVEGDDEGEGNGSGEEEHQTDDEEQETEVIEDEAPIQHNEIPDSEDDEREGEEATRFGLGRLYLGQKFYSGDDFKQSVLHYALSSGTNIEQDRWEQNRLAFKCGMRRLCNCGWYIYCAYDEPTAKWVVKSFRDSHTCQPNSKCKILKSPVIAKLFMDKLRKNENFMPLEIQEAIKEKWKLSASSNQCQKGRLLALKWIQMEYDQQFSHLRGYCEEIRSTNPGSSCDIETELGPNGEDQKGVLLSAIGRDPNNQIYPLAWAIVQSENAPNWLWFIKKIKGDLNLDDGSGFIIVSDRQKGLINAVREEIPKAEHRWCVKHIYENLKKNHGKKSLLKPLIWSLAWSYSPTEYAENLKKIKDYNQRLHDDVLKEDPKSWCRAFFAVGNCCEDVDNNFTESFNASIVKARNKSMIPMLETIRRQIMVRICRRKARSHKHLGRFTEYVNDILELQREEALKCKVYVGTHGMHEVHLFGTSYVVNIVRHTCSCCKWEISGIPCVHAYGAILHSGLSADAFISEYFLTSRWRDTYNSAPIPIRGARFWMGSTESLVTAPPEPVLPGRKKEKKMTTKQKKRKQQKQKKQKFPRKKGLNESPSKKTKKKEVLSRSGRVMHCSKCGQAGHNVAGCAKRVREDGGSSSQVVTKRARMGKEVVLSQGETSDASQPT